MRIACVCSALCLLALARVAVVAADPPTPEAPAPLKAVVTTTDDEQISGTVSGLTDGKLTLATDPPRTIDLIDVQRIELGKLLVASAGDLVWIGQDNHDLVQVGGAPGGNGIQDLHLRVTNLKPLALKQITAVCRFAKQLRVWRLDTSQSPHWRLGIARAGDAAADADFYLEPASDDSFGLAFEVTFTYSDGSTVKSSVTATTHTSDQLKLDRNVQPQQGSTVKNAVPASGTKGEVFLIGQGRLQGDLVELNPESLTLRTPWKIDVQIPILRASGVWFGNTSPPGARADFDKQLAAPLADDVVFLVSPVDKTAAQVQGGVKSLAEGKLNLRFEDNDRSINQDRLLGLVFAAHPKIPPIEGVFQTLVISTGDTISGHWVGLHDGKLEVDMPWKTRWQVPASAVAEIRVRNGKLVFLGDLDPIAVEEAGYFGRVIHWRRDQGFDDGPAKLKGKTASRSIAMHSRSLLTYALDGQFDKFKATVGFDDSAAGRGRVLCRVSADGRELFLQKDLRADQEPMPLDVSVQGAKQLTLEVDFGEAEDIGDRVIWAEPRLFRSAGK